MKILVNIFKYDYGLKKNGLSFEYLNFYESFVLLGYNVRLFDYGSLEQKYGQAEMNKMFIQVVEGYKPDLIFSIFHPGHFTNETLKLVKAKKLKSVIWMTDDEWMWEGFSKNVCNFFHYVITTDPLAIKKYQAMNYKNAILSHWGVNTNRIKKLRLKKDIDVSFVGFINPWRSYLIDCLKKNGINVRCFGFGWENGRLSLRKMNEIFCRSKIVLNISNSVQLNFKYLFRVNLLHRWNKELNYKTNLYYILPLLEYFIGGKRKDQVKARVFEVPASGSFLLSHRTYNLSNFFVLDKEIATYKNENDLIMKINHYLTEDKIREDIAQKAYLKTIRNYSYQRIVERLVTTILKN